MTKMSIKVEQTAKNFIDCERCAMQAVCQPITTDEQSLDLTENYLTRRVPVNSEQASTSHIAKTPDAMLLQNHQPLTAIYAVCSGVFKLYIDNEDGSEKIIGFRFPGELIGEDAIYQNKYNYNAIAIGESSVCEVSFAKLNACGQLAPELQQNLIQLLAKQSFNQQRNNQTLIGKKSADSLLAAFLLNICQRNAEYSYSETHIDLTISRTDIANFLGIRRETLSRLLSKFQQVQLICIKGKMLEILSQEKLLKLSSC